MCEAEGKLTAANIVDHIIPHKGDTRLFWDTANWQSLCEQHHNKAKQIEERAADKCSFNNNGLPDDPNHPWNDSRWSDNDQ